MVRPQDGREGEHIVIRMLGAEMPGKRKEMVNILHVGLRRKGAFFVRNEHWVLRRDGVSTQQHA